LLLKNVDICVCVENANTARVCDIRHLTAARSAFFSERVCVCKRIRFAETNNIERERETRRTQSLFATESNVEARAADRRAALPYFYCSNTDARSAWCATHIRCKVEHKSLMVFLEIVSFVCGILTEREPLLKAPRAGAVHRLSNVSEIIFLLA